MKVKDNPKVYKWILVLSSIALTFMVTFLVFNTYKLKDESFHTFQKESMVAAYGHYIKNDKLFPGGNAVFTDYFENQLPDLFAIDDKATFEKTKDSVVNELISHLQQASNFDAIFNQILTDQHLDKDFIYKLTFDKLEIMKDPALGWFTIYGSKAPYAGATIAGTLKKVSSNNRALQLSVNDNHGYDYRFTYNLYIDRPNRVFQVIKDMSLVLFFSISCIVLTILINYRTFQNWVSQRKETQLKNDFIQHIRHEFNTPITTILVAARTLNEMSLLGKDAKDVFETSAIIERQGMRLRAYVKQILTSITMEEQEPELLHLDIDELTSVLLRDIALRFEDKITITYQKVEKPYFTWVDTLLYLCILDNLVENAYKFNKEKEKNVHIFWKDASKDSVHLCVQDNGIGIKDQDMDYIFNKFYRSKSTPTKSGLGLGLYYSYLSATKMGWQIKTIAHQAQGTLFEITIPLKSV